MEPPANVFVRKSRSVVMNSITTMIHVNASVETHQIAHIHTIMILTHASVSADLMTATQVSTLTRKAVAASVVDT